ncbi:MAG: glycosyltransferase [Minisyncoccia bacterium]
MKKNPQISIVMPAYNAESFIEQAIKSILEQSFSDFEFIIINDGSTDDTENIIKSFKDERIVFINNDGNKGLSYSFNVGIKQASGKYIARMDADDISVKNRLQTQFNFLEKHPRIGVIGSVMISINENGKKLSLLKREREHINIKWSSLFSTPMFHPTIMARADIMKNNPYDEKLTNSEDYDLWSRLLFNTDTHFENLDKPLLLYRTFPKSFTQTLNLDKRALSAHNTIKNIKRFINLTREEENLIIKLKQERSLNIKNLIQIFLIYLKAATTFILKEHLGIKKIPSIYGRVFGMFKFLVKYEAKHIFKKVN